MRLLILTQTIDPKDAQLGFFQNWVRAGVIEKMLLALAYPGRSAAGRSVRFTRERGSRTAAHVAAPCAHTDDLARPTLVVEASW